MAAVLFVVTVPTDRKPANADSKDDDPTKDQSDGNLEDFVENRPMHEVLEMLLKDMQVNNAAWMVTSNDMSYQVTFTCKGPLLCEAILNKLTDAGIGKQPETSICIVPASIYFSQEPDDDDKEEEEEDEMEKSGEHAAMVTPTRQGSFLKSIKSRLTVAQVVETVQNAGDLTFDFVILIILASIIAAIGLSEDSSVILVASMLISPLMGPILAGTFGTVIAHVKLRNLGMKTEIIGLLLCIICGFIFGLVLGTWGDVLGWPTEAMSSRGELRGLVVGVFIALPSGAAVAISVLGGNIGSLVGVAISASLLPPAVNAGILWAYALLNVHVIGYVETETTIVPVTYDPTNLTLGSNITNEHTASMEYQNPALDLFVAGSISLVLTLLNIVCIFIVGIIVLKIKEVAPHTSSATTSHFWKTDIKVARSYYQTIENQHQGQLLGKMFYEEWEKLNSDTGEASGTERVKGTEAAIMARRFQTLLEKIEGDKTYQHIIKELPSAQPVSRHLPSEWMEQTETNAPLSPIVQSPLILASDRNPFFVSVSPRRQTSKTASPRRQASKTSSPRQQASNLSLKSKTDVEIPLKDAESGC